MSWTGAYSRLKGDLGALCRFGGRVIWASFPVLRFAPAGHCLGERLLDLNTRITEEVNRLTTDIHRAVGPNQALPREPDGSLGSTRSRRRAIAQVPHSPESISRTTFTSASSRKSSANTDDRSGKAALDGGHSNSASSATRSHSRTIGSIAASGVGNRSALSDRISPSAALHVA